MGDDFPTSLSHLRFCMADNVAIMADNVAIICWLLVVFHYYSKKKRERERESETERERVRLRERERESDAKSRCRGLKLRKHVSCGYLQRERVEMGKF